MICVELQESRGTFQKLALVFYVFIKHNEMLIILIKRVIIITVQIV